MPAVSQIAPCLPLGEGGGGQGQSGPLRMPIELRHRVIATNGVRLHAVEAGPPEGRLLILLHGFPEFWYGWHRHIETFAAAGYRVLVPDPRGYHLSDKP